MESKEKRQILKSLINANTISESSYYEALEKTGDMKYNYGDYLITEPIDCDTELARLKDADYELCCVLLTMLLREDHFSNGSFESRYRAGQVKPIVEKMITLLSSGE
jgi:hypothetical protein